MEYIGEHLLIGKVGNVFILLSFVFALLASVSYFFASKENSETTLWKRIARNSFRIHSLSVFGIVVTLFFMLKNHYFEYEYVWHHSNKELPLYYILSCFWEGQEGSFLLWTFWHVVIGFILQRTAKEWEAPVMTSVSLVQAFLASMLLGIYVFETRIGSNPFTVLLREHPDFSNIPLFQNPDYLKNLDGRGLNPLLQNYWMTIHPPVLFLGFALTLIPFAYAIAGLWKKKYNGWQKPALPWTFFCIAILGMGILMGGAWAYEALSFGGFWAWDPVENASLVPWLIVVGAGHVMLVHKNKGRSVLSTFAFSILGFILILYSTFLTRSGILGESSVHAFTDLGMSGQLLIYLFFFVVLSIVLLIINWKHIPKQEDEEAIGSREFWMFIGSLVLLLSSFQIIFYTSMPVWNKMFGLNKAPASNVAEFYNSWQIPFAVVITLLIAITQFLKYKNTDIRQFIKKIMMSFAVAAVITIIVAIGLSMVNYFYCALLFSSVFSITANFDYLIRVMKGNVRKGGASIAHVGFGLIMLGALLSTSKKEIISVNTSGKSIESLGKEFSNNTNILLTAGDTLQMGNYFVSYKGKKKEGVNIYFEVEYFSKKKDGDYQYEFTLFPLVQSNKQMGNIAEPDTRHFLDKDIYTHVTYADLEMLEEKGNTNDYLPAKNHTIKVGDTIASTKAILILESLDTELDQQKYNLSDNDIAVGAKFKIIDMNMDASEASPIYVIRNNNIEPIDATIDKLGLKITFWRINPADSTIEISLSEKKSINPDFIVMEAIIFPYINILWIGCVLMVIGTIIAIKQRVKA